jgi:hypothetical protein
MPIPAWVLSASKYGKKDTKKIQRRKSSMKSCKFSLFFILLVAACFPAAAQNPRMRVNVPFDFTVNGKLMPAGEYTVAPSLQHDNIAWAIYRDHNAVITMTNWIQSPGKAHTPSLVFLKAGGQFFLVQIWNEQYSGRELPAPDVKRFVVAENSTYVEVGAE